MDCRPFGTTLQIYFRKPSHFPRFFGIMNSKDND